MKKKKIMWLCNARFSSEKIRATGSWLQPLAEHLQQTGMVDIVNITIDNVAQIVHEQLDGIEQYVIPSPHKKHHGQVGFLLTQKEQLKPKLFLICRAFFLLVIIIIMEGFLLQIWLNVFILRNY